jgi:hypothetical protein
MKPFLRCKSEEVVISTGQERDAGITADAVASTAPDDGGAGVAPACMAPRMAVGTSPRPPRVTAGRSGSAKVVWPRRELPEVPAQIDGRLLVIESPGDHRTLLAPTQVDHLAERLVIMMRGGIAALEQFLDRRDTQ